MHVHMHDVGLVNGFPRSQHADAASLSSDAWLCARLQFDFWSRNSLNRLCMSQRSSESLQCVSCLLPLFLFVGPDRHVHAHGRHDRGDRSGVRLAAALAGRLHLGRVRLQEVRQEVHIDIDGRQAA